MLHNIFEEIAFIVVKTNVSVFKTYVTKEEIWLSFMTKVPTPTEKSKKQRDNTKTPPKTSIIQRLRTTATQLVW